MAIHHDEIGASFFGGALYTFADGARERCIHTTGGEADAIALSGSDAHAAAKQVVSHPLE